jgi:hypothetical protein
MKHIIDLNLDDIKQIISNYFDVDIKNVSVTSCGEEIMGGGPWLGSEKYYCYIEVEKND